MLGMRILTWQEKRTAVFWVITKGAVLFLCNVGVQPVHPIFRGQDS